MFLSWFGAGFDDRRADEEAKFTALIGINGLWARRPWMTATQPLVRMQLPADDCATMPLLALSALRALLGKDQRLIGIDPGSKTIGLALSDVRLLLASPFGSLKRRKLQANAAEIVAIARQENAGGLVVGLPLSMDGTVGPAAQGARDWALALSEATGLPAALFDERLSSAAANRFLISEADISRRKRNLFGRPAGGKPDAAGRAGCQSTRLTPPRSPLMKPACSGM